MSDPTSDLARETMEQARPSLSQELAGHRLHDGQDRWDAAYDARMAGSDRADDKAPARWWLA